MSKPDLKVHWVWKKIIDFVSSVHYIYWVILITLLLTLSVNSIGYVEPFWQKIVEYKLLVGLILVFALSPYHLYGKKDSK